MSENKNQPLLEVKDLKQHFNITGGGSPKMAAARADTDPAGFLPVIRNILSPEA